MSETPSNSQVASLIEDFQTAIENNNLDQAQALAPDLLTAYQERNAHDAQIQTQLSHLTGPDSDLTADEIQQVSAYLNTALVTRRRRARFLASAGMFVDAPDTADLDFLATTASEAKTAEETLVKHEQKVTKHVANRSFPPNLTLLAANPGTKIAQPNDHIDITIEIQNTGDDPARNLSFTTETPDAVTLTTASTPKSLDPGATTTISVSATADTPGTYTVSFTVTGASDTATVSGSVTLTYRTQHAAKAHAKTVAAEDDFDPLNDRDDQILTGLGAGVGAGGLGLGYWAYQHYTETDSETDTNTDTQTEADADTDTDATGGDSTETE